MNEKILDIKISEEDYERIIIALAIAIQKCEENAKNPILNDEEIEKNEFNKEKYKKIITKLSVCRLYNN